MKKIISIIFLLISTMIMITSCKLTNTPYDEQQITKGGGIYSASCSENNICIITPMNSEPIVFDLISNKILYEIGHIPGEPVEKALISKDGKYAYTIQNNYEESTSFIVRWDILSGNYVSTFNVSSLIDKTAISYDGKYLLFNDKEKATILDMTNNRNMAEIYTPDHIWAIDISNDGTKVLLSIDGGQIEHWDLINGEKTHTWNYLHNAKITKFIDHNNSIINIVNKNQINIYSADEFKQINQIDTYNMYKNINTGRNNTINIIEFDKNDKFILIGKTPSKISLWNNQHDFLLREWYLPSKTNLDRTRTTPLQIKVLDEYFIVITSNGNLLKYKLPNHLL